MHRIPRRRFVKGLFLGTAFSSIAGKSWSSLYGATLTPASRVATFEIKVSDYPALQEEIGSVRLGTSFILSGGFPDGRYYPIIINRDENNFYVLNAMCKHAGCTVNTYDTFASGMECRCHGSLYDIRGDVIREPATEALTPHEFTFDGADKLTIVVPEMGFEVKAFVPNPEPATRLQLQFTAEGGIRYEVSYREQLAHAWQRASFSLAPEGPADQEQLLGTGELNTIYLDRTSPTGFYAVSMVLQEV